MFSQEQFEALLPLILDSIKTKILLKTQEWQLINPSATKEELTKKSMEFFAVTVVDIESKLPKEISAFLRKEIVNYRERILRTMN